MTISWNKICFTIGKSIGYEQGVLEAMPMKARRFGFFLTVIFTLTIFSSLISPSAHAKVTGPCANCHTMHNSQAGSPMVEYGAGETWGSTEPQPALLRGTCLGCHGQGGSSKILTIGGSEIPQVYHTDSTDLAAGNFAYILGAKGSGASDAKGHNVIDIVNDDSVLDGPPGPVKQYWHENCVTDSNLTCAGDNGCHGYRYAGKGTGIPAIKGAHHGNEDGQCATADTAANSYRFLFGVKGLENTTDKWQNKNAGSHNEYYGTTTPPKLGCGGGEVHCHLAGGVGPPNYSISGFCGTCHGNFHGLTGGSGSGTSDGIGIGGSTSAPFQRHPSDIVIKNEGEYQLYTTYSVEAPVGRTTVPETASSGVSAGVDVVTCLSCHTAHASDYPDLLRWDYNTMFTGVGGSGGCFTCHAEKDGS
jgi:predicted CXXCH cytochrome family protein